MGRLEKRVILKVIAVNIEGKTRREKAERIFRALQKNPEMVAKAFKSD